MTKAQHILSVTTFFPPTRGGLPNHVYHITRNLSQLGNTLSLISPKLNGITQTHYYDQFKKVYPLNSFFLPGWPYPTLRSVGIPKDLGKKMKSVIRNGDFDIVHVHGHHFPFSWFAVKWAKKYEIPIVLTLHGMYGLNPNVLGGKTTIENLLNKYFFKKIFSNVNAIIGLTGQITNYAKIFTNEFPRFYTIPNGVNVNVYKENLQRKNEYRKHYKIDNNSVVILFRGRFEHVKGILEFAKAAKKLVKNDKIEIVIVGGGSLTNSVKTIVAGIDRIHLFDWQPDDVVHELYITSDIFVIPSRFEALPLAIMESMNAGLHIVYSQVGGVPEILKKYPRCTPIQDISDVELVNVLNKVISNFDVDNISESLSYAGKFDWKSIANDTNNVYTDCLNHIE